MAIRQDLLFLSMVPEPICDCPLTYVHGPGGLSPVPDHVDTFKEPKVRVIEIHR
jgi:hypothetical protein